jgi:hypothetical protein
MKPPIDATLTNRIRLTPTLLASVDRLAKHQHQLRHNKLSKCSEFRERWPRIGGRGPAARSFLHRDRGALAHPPSSFCRSPVASPRWGVEDLQPDLFSTEIEVL